MPNGTCLMEAFNKLKEVEFFNQEGGGWAHPIPNFKKAA